MLKMKIKNVIRKSLSVIIAAAAVCSLQMTNTAFAEGEYPAIWTDGSELNNCFCSDGVVRQAITFGQKQWYLAGRDQNSYILMCSPATGFGNRAFWDDGSQNVYEYSSVRHYLTLTKDELLFPEEEYALSSFSDKELALMKDLNSEDPSAQAERLFLPSGVLDESVFKVSAGQSVIDISLLAAPYNSGEAFWLKPAGSSEQYALDALPGSGVSEALTSESHAILPVMCLELPPVCFASAAAAGTAGTSFVPDAAIPGRYAMALRYYDTEGKITSTAYRSSDGVYVEKGSESGDVYLYIQNNEGNGWVWSARVEGSVYYATGEVNPGAVSLDGCRIWLETSDGNLAYAKEAEVYVPSVTAVELDQTQLNFMTGDAPVYITASVVPQDAPDTTVTWYSSNEEVAFVDLNGLVTPVNAGSATITAMSNADNTIIATCEVTVSPYTAYGSITFGGSVSLDGRELTEYDQFFFTLSEIGNEGEVLIATAQNDIYGNVAFPEITYFLDSDHNDTGLHTYIIREMASESTELITDTSEYTVTVSVNDDYHNGILTVLPDAEYVGFNFTNTVIPRANINLSAAGFSGIYDGMAHYVEVSAEVTDGTVISYSTNGTDWSTEAPYIIDAGAFTVYVKAENPNCETETAEVTLEVIPAAVTVTADNAAKTYGTEDPGFTAAIEGLVNNETEDMIVYTISREAGENAGTYAIVVSGEAVQGNYSVAYANAEFIINPAPAVVTANDSSKAYGAADPVLTATVSGLLNEDPAELITYSLYREEGEEAGTYAIIPQGEAVQGNYTVSYVPGTFTITQQIKPGLTAEGYSGTYDGSAHYVSAYTEITDGTVISYSTNGTDWSTDLPYITDVGTFTVYVKAENPNCETETAEVTLEVIPAAVTVTADNAAKTYGTEDPGFTATVSGLVNNETEDMISYTISREEGEDAGVYAIIVSGNSAQGNYSVAFKNADFIITHVPVSVIANDVSKAFGTEDPALTAKVIGLVNNETPEKIIYEISREAGEETGTYSIIPKGDTEQGNYTVSYISGTFTITEPDKKINLNAAGYSGIYDGLAHYANASASVTEGTVISYSTNGTDWSTAAPYITNVGSITVYVKAENPKCETETAEVILDVAPAAVTVTANDSSKAYAAADPVFTAVVSGLVNNETADKIVYSISRSAGEESGTYTIVVYGETTQGNYTVSFIPGTFTIRDKIVYTAVDVDDLKWMKGDFAGLSVTVKASSEDEMTFGKFRQALVDKITVQPKDMVISAGSLNLTLNASYLELISAGEHTLDIIFSDGAVSVPFSIKEKETPTPTATPVLTATPTITQTPTTTPTITPAPTNTPGISPSVSPKPSASPENDKNADNRNTGDRHNRMIWIMLIIAAAAITAAVLISRRKE